MQSNTVLSLTTNDQLLTLVLGKGLAWLVGLFLFAGVYFFMIGVSHFVEDALRLIRKRTGA